MPAIRIANVSPPPTSSSKDKITQLEAAALSADAGAKRLAQAVLQKMEGKSVHVQQAPAQQRRRVINRAMLGDSSRTLSPGPERKTGGKTTREIKLEDVEAGQVLSSESMLMGSIPNE